MYPKQSKIAPLQLRIEEFYMPFGGKLKTTNKWVILSKLIPWNEFENDYAALFSQKSGALALPFRIALGSLIIKERLGLSDRDTLEQIEENPYLQYFLGYAAFLNAAPFDHSMMTHFRNRISEKVLSEINQRIIQRNQNQTNSTDNNQHPGPTSQSDKLETEKPQENEGKMILDATCTPADIRYPTDLSLLNEAREKSNKFVTILWNAKGEKGKKPRTYSKEGRKAFLNASRKKRLTLMERRKAIRKQLGFLSRNLRTIAKLGNLKDLAPKDYITLLIINELHRQQWKLYKEKKQSVSDRIVSISQPHIRPIVRGKVGKPTEFGAKISASLVDGFVYLDRISFNSYNESEDLVDQVEAYKLRFGKYPEKVLADQIYRTRLNHQFCKEKGIKLSGKPLGRPPKEGYSSEIKKEWRSDECERVLIEGKFGQLKRRFSLSRVMAKAARTTKAVIGIAFLVVNLERVLFVPILNWLKIHLFTKSKYQTQSIWVRAY